MRTLLIIGQAPSKSGNPAAPLEGQTGQRLAELFGCSYAQYLKATQRINLLPEWPGRNANGDKFPIRLARINAHRMSYSFDDCLVLFLGIGVARAFDVTHEPLRWIAVARQDKVWLAAILPHTSGVNRWWNDVRNHVEAESFMRSTWGFITARRRICKSR